MITYVIYSGGIQHVKEKLDCGLYTYRIHPIYMKEFNAGQIFRRLHEKQKAGEPFTEEDFAGLTLSPLMAGGYGKKDAIKEAIQLAKVSQEEASGHWGQAPETGDEEEVDAQRFARQMCRLRLFISRTLPAFRCIRWEMGLVFLQHTADHVYQSYLH